MANLCIKLSYFFFSLLEVAGKYCGIRSVAVYGGVSKDGQRRSLSNKNPFEIVVATPGKGSFTNYVDILNVKLPSFP